MPETCFSGCWNIDAVDEALAMGTVQQPKKLEEGLEFWKDKEGVQMFEGPDCTVL